MKYLGIDYGTKKIGIAISDESGSFAFPFAIISTIDAIKEIDRVCKKEDCLGIVVGQSVASNGKPNAISMQVQRFAELLHAQTGVRIFFEEETYSSVEAHRYQTKAGDRDDSAAAIILQRFLDKHTKNK